MLAEALTKVPDLGRAVDALERAAAGLPKKDVAGFIDISSCCGETLAALPASIDAVDRNRLTKTIVKLAAQMLQSARSAMTAEQWQEQLKKIESDARFTSLRLLPEIREILK